MDITEIKLAIATACIAAGQSSETAQKWVDWISTEESQAASAESSLVSDADLEADLWNQFGRAGRISWYDFITAMRCDSQLSLKVAFACAVLYGISRKTRDVIIDAIDRKDVDGQIPYCCDYYGNSQINGKYHINKQSLIKWLDANYKFQGTGVVKQFWDEFLSRIKES